MSDAGEPEFNPIFNQFVDVDAAEDELLSGLVAYGLYKIAKREWVAGVTRRSGAPPGAAEMLAYVETWTPALVRGKQEQALGVLSRFADSVVAAQGPAIVAEALKGSLWKAVGYGLAANVIYTMILLALALVLKWAGVDVLGLIERVGAPR